MKYMKQPLLLIVATIFLPLFLVVPVAAHTNITVLDDGVIIYSGSIKGDDSQKGGLENKKEEPRERKVEEQRIEIKRENVEFRIEPGKVVKTEIQKKATENERARLKSTIEVRQEMEKRIRNNENLPEAQKEALKRKIEIEKEKEEKLRPKKIKTIEDDSMSVEIDEGLELEKRPKDDKLLIRSGRAEVSTGLPVVVSPGGTGIIVEDKERQREIEIKKPDDLIRELRGVGLTATAVDNQYRAQLINEDGKIKYRLDGASKQKLFGVLPVQVKKEVDVAADSGRVLETRQSVVNRLLDLFSF